MKRLAPGIVLSVLLGLSFGAPCRAAGGPHGLYLGETPPGTTPEVFAPGIISLPDRYEYCIVFSPDLSECVFGITNLTWSVFTMFYTSMDADSVWSATTGAPFQGVGDGLMATYARDGSRVLFASSRPSYPPVNLWSSARNAGGWDPPVLVPDPVSSAGDEFGPTLTADGTLYFVSTRAGGAGEGDLYRSVPVGGEYTTVENLGPPINTASNEGAPYIADDESFLIFESARPGGYGQSDLYISYRQGDSWTEPQNLGPTINTEQIEDGPFLSPDGKYLFFNRRQAYVTTTQTDVWWVDASVLPGPADAPEGDLGLGSLLRQNQPNPASDATTIAYTVPVAGRVEIEVHDATGRFVRNLVDRVQQPGDYSVELRAESGSDLPSGVYYYRMLLSGTPVMTRKMLVVR
ncbi:MAG: T9SS type A sorting domain-containing protein [Candidatus Eisenbacteria bacterium]|uniref:PD40 domain-containing protein n=1 Tax=Eiseniibacteriota bacterium TaxID=2212470 RepID=A0A956LZJ9_UNCEI|nr:PD40 domain-containing protein [Candidatus Eisenbacteria bacterium]